MKATLEFNLPEDQAKFDYAVKASDMYFCLDDIDSYCRGQIKHGDIDELCEEKLIAVREIIMEINR